MTGDLWEVRTLHGGLSLELRGGESRDGMRTKPALVVVQGSDQVRVHCGILRPTPTALLAVLNDGLRVGPLPRKGGICEEWRRTEQRSGTRCAAAHCAALNSGPGLPSVGVLAVGAVYHA